MQLKQAYSLQPPNNCEIIRLPFFPNRGILENEKDRN